MPSSMPEYKVETLYSGTGTMPEFWRGYLKKCVFTSVLINNRSRAPCSGTKSERGLRDVALLLFLLLIEASHIG